MKVVNTDGTTANPTIEELKAQLGEPRQLPTGMTELKEWMERIISAVHFPVDRRSLEWTLATQLMQIGPIESHKPDGYFIKALHACATKEIAHNFMNELKEQAKVELQALKDKEAQELAELKRAVKAKKKNKTVATPESDVAVQQ